MIYPHVIMEFAGQTWAIQIEKLEQIAAFLSTKSAGGAVSAEAREEYRAARAEELARITRAQEDAAQRSGGKIALIPIYGTIAQRMNMGMEMSGGTSTQMLGAAFRSALSDTNVSAIVFDVNSPGGTVSGTGELAAEILDSRGSKPIVAQVNSMAASGAYWLASAADEIVVTPGGEAGSLGVYRIHEDITKALENEGVKPTIIRSSQSPFKIEDSGLEPLTGDAFAHQQARVDQSMDTFIRAIARGRGATLTTVRDRFGQGRMFGAEELVSRGMVDRIDTLEGTLERFGSGFFNPIANAAREYAAARVQATDLLKAKWKAGEPPTTRELQDGLRGILGLSKSEAEQAVRLSFKGSAPGDPARQTEIAVSVADFTDLKTALADIRKTLETTQAA